MHPNPLRMHPVRPQDIEAWTEKPKPKPTKSVEETDNNTNLSSPQPILLSRPIFFSSLSPKRREIAVFEQYESITDSDNEAHSEYPEDTQSRRHSFSHQTYSHLSPPASLKDFKFGFRERTPPDIPRNLAVTSKSNTAAGERKTLGLATIREESEKDTPKDTPVDDRDTVGLANTTEGSTAAYNW